MAVKTLSSAQAIALPGNMHQSRTYSIAPGSVCIPEETSYASAVEIGSFLEGENPLGCIRGVMWVMAFNVAVFLLGVAIWQSCKLLF